MKLDDATARTLTVPAGKGEHSEYDDEQPGFGIRIRDTGGRTWFAMLLGKRYPIGAIAKVSCKAARAKAKELLAQVTLGGNPHAAKASERKAQRFSLLTVAQSYLESRQPFLRPASYRVTRLYLTGSQYFGPLHRMDVRDIGLSDVANRLNVIARDSGHVTAGRARAALHALYGWAATQGLLGERPTNPVTATRVQDAVTVRDRVLSDAELIEIWNATDSADDHSRITRLMLLTAQRRSEVGGLVWDEVDMGTGLWVLPKERAKNGHMHTITLPPLALQILRDVPRRADRDHVFGDRGEAGFTGWAALRRRLNARLGSQVQPWQLRDLRRTAATGMANIGIQPHIIEEILNHREHRTGVAAVYNRSSYSVECRTALLRWSDHIAALVEGRATRVIAFERPGA